MIGYHVTTAKRLKQYSETGGILPPVRFWPDTLTAERWARRTQRPIIIKVNCETSYPLPDHKPARWSPDFIRDWAVISFAIKKGVKFKCQTS
jgi:hypothetical protein